MIEPFEINIYVEDDFVTDYHSIVVPSIGHTVCTARDSFRVISIEWRIGMRFCVNLYCEKL